MDFDLSDDQVALRDAARALLDRHASPERVRAHVGPGTAVGSPGGTAPHGFDADLWAAMVEQGWTGVDAAEDLGGLGLSMVEVAVLAEEVGRHVAPAPFGPTALAAGALVRAAGAGPAEAVWAERLVRGEAVGCVAWASRPEQLRVEHRRGAVVVSGRPDPVLYGPSADVAVLLGPEAVVAVALDGSAGAARPAPEEAMDRTRELGWLTLEDAPAILLGGPEEAGRLWDRVATVLSAELLGAADRALEMAVAYAKDRVQFGRPIGSFQAVKHRLADALVDVEGMRSTVYYAAWCTATEDPEAPLAASMAKAWCSEAAARVMASCLQVHGGIGFTWEHDLHLYLKRAQLDQVSFGDAPAHRDRIADLLRSRLAAGRGIV